MQGLPPAPSRPEVLPRSFTSSQAMPSRPPSSLSMAALGLGPGWSKRPPEFPLSFKL